MKLIIANSNPVLTLSTDVLNAVVDLESTITLNITDADVNDVFTITSIMPPDANLTNTTFRWTPLNMDSHNLSYVYNIYIYIYIYNIII